MKKPRLNTGFDGLSDPNFQTTAESIYASMFENKNFLTPTPALTVIDEAIQAYSSAFIAAQQKEKNAVAIKNQMRDNLTGLLIQLANSVMTTANGDKTMLISSGFELAKEGETTPIVKPASISLTDGLNAGELVVKVPRVKGSIGYGPQYTTDPLTTGSQWTAFMTTTSKYTFTNLEPAKKYWCRVAVIGPYNQLVYSDAVSRIAQ
ncbi:MAG: hypothetical protein KGM16_01225 [Bacteroidota bacterium]|nr:hypothetical protein [Bacteroidota bacterium]